MLSFIKLWPNLVVCGKFNLLETNVLYIVNEILLGFHVKTNLTKIIAKTKFSANFTRIKLKLTKTNPLHFKLLFFSEIPCDLKENFLTLLKVTFLKGFLVMLSMKNSKLHPIGKML